MQDFLFPPVTNSDYTVISLEYRIKIILPLPSVCAERFPQGKKKKKNINHLRVGSNDEIHIKITP